jgi:cell division protein FtsN
MSKATSNKSAASGKSGSPMLMGILVGMIIGVALAAGLAWFILKSPSPFVNRELAVKPLVETPGPAIIRPVPSGADAAAASGVEDAKPRFEFYKVLTDKQDAAVDAPPKSAAKVTEGKPSGPKYLQAASFANAADAENLKATLVMKGMDVSVQKVTISGKGDMHRVRVGPFQNEQEMNNARGALKLNGLDATPTR